MNKPLFDDFNEVSAKQWKQKIQFDLKGADYNEALIYKSLEGIDIKPFYHQEDLIDNNISVPTPTAWKNSIKIEVNDTIDGQQKAIEAIAKGAENIHFTITNTQTDPEKLLNNIPSKITVYIENKFISNSFTQKVNEIALKNNLDIFIFTDIIGNLAQTGNWYANLKSDHQELEKVVSNNNLKGIISVDLGLYQNAGATMVQQLAYGLAHANEYLNHFNNTSISFFKKTPIIFKVALGGNYFFEIAKLRALRVLWSTLAEAYDVHPKCHILAYPSLRNKTFLDYNVNMLRTTTECMSAILGGADTIQNLPYDTIYHLENGFASRIALNQLLILKNESYFDLVANPASGSYYIESLTSQISEKVLELFKNIEKGGGFLQQLKSGVIQKKIKESALKEQALFDDEKIVLTGVNAFENSKEVIPNFEKPIFPQKKARKTLIQPITTSRLPYKIEHKTVNK